MSENIQCNTRQSIENEREPKEGFDKGWRTMFSISLALHMDMEFQTVDIWGGSLSTSTNIEEPYRRESLPGVFLFILSAEGNQLTLLSRRKSQTIRLHEEEF